MWRGRAGRLLRLLLAGSVPRVLGAAAEADLAEFQHDFQDFDANRDGQIDAQEMRQQFKGDLDPEDLHQFFIDVDRDSSGTITLGEYVDYAVSNHGKYYDS